MGEVMLREKISTQKIQSNWLQKFSKEIFCIVAFSFFTLLTSCNNIGSLANRIPSSEIILSDPSSGSGTSGSFRLNGVYASQQSPGTMFDMVGQDSQFDTYCSGTNGPCVCEYTYISPGIGSVTDEGEVQYQESNLIRCNNVVPTGVASFDVKILAKGSGDYSNPITGNLSSGAFVNTNYVDLTKEQAFTPVKRFQCRKREFIANPMSKAMIDPIQSEDPRVIYPFNYYTTNVASSLWSMQKNGSDWDCTLTPTFDRSLHWWANPNVYSAAPCTEAFCAGDGELMYPQDSLVSNKVPVPAVLPHSNGKRRGSFYLAKQSYGVFQIPVNAAIAPKDYVSANYGPIGYAARPIPSSGGSSACPSIPLPSNAEWVKLWNFRATDITSPKKVTDTIATLNSGIVCNPKRGFFPSCDNDRTVSAINKGFTSQTLSAMGNDPDLSSFSTDTSYGSSTLALDATTIASRVVLFTSNSSSSSGGLAPNACYNITAMGGGAEAWEPSAFAFAPYIDRQNMYDLPWSLYHQVDEDTKMTTSVCGDNYNYVDHIGYKTPLDPAMSCSRSVRLMQDNPTDTQLTSVPLNPSNYTDQIFVVTSPDVNDGLMISQASAVDHYRPITYKTSNDCNGLTRTGCSSVKEYHWYLNVKDVGKPNDPDQYPLCVLQFTD
jgi:hypothetical protein